ncbi:MAG: alcohol dehydrogenase [Chloroflexi bacterium]|nr:MAG: alcohol dehydrogenase [Chloroflexota bacterium]MBL1195756.1 alcohol dehydrogenase [Chloroflexota bacterium]NOH13045.1 zinc-binding dehydrogenase [Chloroflexota bacterium]
MKAVYIKEHGGPEKLEYGDLPTPEAGEGQVLVRLEAAALNHMDLFLREGWPGLKIEYPHIFGADGAGTIEAVGPGVSQWQGGERVVINANLSDGSCEFCQAGFENRCSNWHLLGETVSGTYAEYLAIPASNLKRVPDGFDLHQAAAAALVYLTAWHSLVSRGGVHAGENVLIVGASGGVNTASIQIAKHLGAEVYVVGSSSNKLELTESLGADHLIDRSKEENWSKTVFLESGKRGMDVVVDNVGTTFPMSLRAARKGGRILTVGNTAGPKFEIDNRFVFAKHLSILGSTMGTNADFEAVMDLVFEGSLKAVVDKTYLLQDAKDAQARLESGEQLGKITLNIK